MARRFKRAHRDEFAENYVPRQYPHRFPLWLVCLQDRQLQSAGLFRVDDKLRIFRHSCIRDWWLLKVCSSRRIFGTASELSAGAGTVVLRGEPVGLSVAYRLWDVL